MENIEFIKDGENGDVGRFNVGDKLSVSDKIADTLIKRDSVAKLVKKESKTDGRK